MNITEYLRERGIEISNKRLSKILGTCMTCKIKDKKIKITCKFVEVEKPGEKIGIDILELTAGDKVITAIDYFSRKMFAVTVKSKEAIKVKKFLEKIHNEFPFKKLISDSGKEFDNNEVRNWTKMLWIEHVFLIPYYHQSNGRIERANRTIRMACRKTPGPTKIKLGAIIENYTNTIHRGIGMSPNIAIFDENWEKVKNHENKYKKEFKKYDKKQIFLKLETGF